MSPNVYLIVNFNFPKPFLSEYAEKVAALRKALSKSAWVKEVLAASGGVGGGPAAIWIFQLHNYAALDRLFHSDDPVSKAYVEFFSAMDDVQDMVREQFTFS